MLESISHALLTALSTAFAMGWEILWALILGLVPSGAVQAVAIRGEPVAVPHGRRLRHGNDIPIRRDQFGHFGRTTTILGCRSDQPAPTG
jgi:hypothetical protein